MKPRERVRAALNHQLPDRVPRGEIWLDAFLDDLGDGDPQAAYVQQGQDWVMLPSINPPESNAWRTGTDDFGRVWQNGMYVAGQVDTAADLAHYTPPLTLLDQLFDADHCAAVRARYPDHALIYGTHIGPFTAAYMAMGFTRFFLGLMDDPAFVRRVLENRTEWCIAQYRRAVELGAEIVVLGDDVAFNDGPMIAPTQYHDLVLPFHHMIVSTMTKMNVPVIWHSDGDIRALLPMAIEAGFVGVHGLEPAAGIDLAAVRREYGRDLALIGNLDIRVLANADPGTDFAAVRHEVDRCLRDGTTGDTPGGYLFATCNSIFDGLNRDAVRAMFDYVDQAQ